MASSSSTDKFRWQSINKLPTKRVFCTPVMLNEHLYIVGGCDQTGTPLDSIESLNLKNKKWTKYMYMPTKRAAPYVASVGNKIIVFGGVAVNQTPLDVVEVFDSTKKQWESVTSMKEKLLGLSGCVKDGKVYVVGGMGEDTNPKNYFMCYDPETDKWASLQPLPTPRYATFSFLINDKLYVLGGRQGKIPVDNCEVYDFEKEEWRTLPSVPSKRVFALYAASNTHIFSLGGLNPNPKDGFSSTTECFNLESETWFIGKPMLNPRGDFAATYLNDKVVVTGGLGNEGKPLQSTEIYDHKTDSWSAISDCPTAHCSCAFITYNEKFHIVGGLATGGPSNCAEELSII